jgi:protein-arginine kinase activator protein McsA
MQLVRKKTARQKASLDEDLRMLCEKCQKCEATIFLVIAKAKTSPKPEHQLCEVCFQKYFKQSPEFQKFNEAKAKSGVSYGWTSYNPIEVRLEEN